VTEQVNATTEKPITAFPTSNTLAGFVNVAGVLDVALRLNAYSLNFEKETGRAPTFPEALNFMVTGDTRSNERIAMDSITEKEEW
jgi:hypothetical protein